jgi:succinoglycan biosynthesis transport protein ExoP
MQGLADPPAVPQPLTMESSPGPAHSIFTPSDLRKILIKRKWILLIFAALGLAGGILYAVRTVPQYEAVAQIQVDLTKSTNIGIESLVSENVSGGAGSDMLIETEIRIMQSESVAMDVINAQDLYHKKPYSDLFQDHPYTGTLSPVDRYHLVGMFLGSTKILMLPNTELIEIHFQNQDPTVARDVANAIVDAYLDRDLKSRYEGTERVSNWLASQLTTVKKQVDAAERNLADYQRANNLVSTDDQGGNLVIDSLRTANEQLAEAQADRIVKEARYKMALTRNPDLLVSVAPGTVLTSLRAQEAELMVESAQLTSKYGSGYPKIRELNKQLASIRSDIETEINNLTNRFQAEYNAAQQTQNLMQGRLDATKQEAYHANESAAQFDILKHDAESASELYDALQMKLKEAGITAGLNSNNVNIIDRAVIPPFPVLPKKHRDIIFGCLGGLLFGIMMAFLLEGLDDTVRTSEDAENISRLPTLAVIPHFVRAERKTVPGESPEVGATSTDLVSYVEPQSIAAEGFRTLRSAIMLSAVDRGSQAILITSSFAAEGKSTCAANLAISFARRNVKVLLVDTDLRKGTLHVKFRLSNRQGLSTVLSRESGAEAYEHPLPDLPNLTVLSRGPIAPNPGEMLASRAMEEMLQQWRTEYDHIVFDSSPILVVADTLSLAPLTDATIVLIRSAVTRKKALLRIRELLRRAGGRLLGTVINDVDLRLENYYTYSKGYDYTYKSTYGSGYGVNDGEK